MTGAELKAALMEEYPVRYAGITYQKITALIYRKAGHYISAHFRPYFAQGTRKAAGIPAS